LRQVTPLLTGFVADQQATNALAAKRAAVEKQMPFLKGPIDAAGSAASFLQVAVDAALLPFNPPARPLACP